MQEISISIFAVKKDELKALEGDKQVLIYNLMTERYHLSTVVDILAGAVPSLFKSKTFKDSIFYFLFDK